MKFKSSLFIIERIVDFDRQCVWHNFIPEVRTNTRPRFLATRIDRLIMELCVRLAVCVSVTPLLYLTWPPRNPCLGFQRSLVLLWCTRGWGNTWWEQRVMLQTNKLTPSQRHSIDRALHFGLTTAYVLSMEQIRLELTASWTYFVIACKMSWNLQTDLWILNELTRVVNPW